MCDVVEGATAASGGMFCADSQCRVFRRAVAGPAVSFESLTLLPAQVSSASDDRHGTKDGSWRLNNPADLTRYH